MAGFAGAMETKGFELALLTSSDYLLGNDLASEQIVFGINVVQHFESQVAYFEIFEGECN